MVQEAWALGVGCECLFPPRPSGRPRLYRSRFIIEGAITVVVAFSAYLVLPNFPRTTMWLSEEERELAVYRLQQDAGVDDQTGDGINHSFFHGFTLALADVRMWLLMLLLTGIVSSASITNFFPTVVRTDSRDLESSIPIMASITTSHPIIRPRLISPGQNPCLLYTSPSPRD